MSNPLLSPQNLGTLDNKYDTKYIFEKALNDPVLKRMHAYDISNFSLVYLPKAPPQAYDYEYRIGYKNTHWIIVNFAYMTHLSPDDNIFLLNKEIEIAAIRLLNMLDEETKKVTEIKRKRITFNGIEEKTAAIIGKLTNCGYYTFHHTGYGTDKKSVITVTLPSDQTHNVINIIIGLDSEEYYKPYNCDEEFLAELSPVVTSAIYARIDPVVEVSTKMVRYNTPWRY